MPCTVYKFSYLRSINTYIFICFSKYRPAPSAGFAFITRFKPAY